MPTVSVKHFDLWTYRGDDFKHTDLTGFGVEASDGSIGTVDEAVISVPPTGAAAPGTGAGRSYLVIDTGPWIFGKKVMVPAGVIDRVDVDDRKVYVGQTKAQIKSAPVFDEMRYHDPEYQDELGIYYSSTYDTTNRPAGPDFGRDDRP